MRALARLLKRFSNFATGHRGDQRLAEEIESHITNQIEENVRAGLGAEEAYREARLKFGNLTTLHQDYGAEMGMPIIEGLMMDVRYALRVLCKTPVFTVVVVLTLMLGIGANVAVFGILNAVLLQPLEVSDPSNLYQLRLKQWSSGRLLTTSYPAFRDFQRRNNTFSDMAATNAYSSAAMKLHGSQVREVHGVEVSGNYFDLLGVRPELGRFFDAAEEHGPGSAPYIVLSDKLWRSAFEADPGVIGTTIELSQHPFTVVGVAATRFHGTERLVWPDYWVPMVNEVQAEGGYDYLHNRNAPAVTILGRLKPGVTLSRANADLDAIAAELAKEYPRTDKGLPMRIIRPGLFGDEGDVIQGALLSVTFLALLLLVAACANLASLFAARTSDRSRELAFRIALGASRWRLLRQLLIEAVLLSLLGGAGGIATATVLLCAIDHWRPNFGGYLVINVDIKVYAVGLALALGSALLFGAVPAWRASQSDPLEAMKLGAGTSRRFRRLALRDILLCAQIAICTILVASALMATRGLVRALHTPLGFMPQNVVLAELDLGQVGQGGDQALVKQKQMIEAVGGIPGVTAVGTTTAIPMNGGARGVPIFREETTDLTLNNAALAARSYTVSPDYFLAAGTKVLGGRDFSWRDAANSRTVALVNATFARIMWGATPAIGQRFIVWGRQREVIGVTEDGKYHDLAEAAEPAIYLPLSQNPSDQVVFVVRSRLASDEISLDLQRVLASIEPNAPISVKSWMDALGGVLFPARAATVALSTMGLLAGMLAATGIFGMAAYSVSRRMKELGIRVALGASKKEVMSAAVGRPIFLLSLGSVLGLAGGVVAKPLLAQIVYQVDPRDFTVIGAVLITMTILGGVASAIPASRALAVDVSRLMRDD